MRIERIQDATLYCGDCLEILPTLGKADAVVTDPPYRLTSGGKTPGGMTGGWLTFDSLNSDSDAYIMANDKNVNMALNAAKNAGFKFHNLLVWDKRTAVANRWYMKNCEFILYLYKGAARRIKDAGSKQLYSVLQIDSSTHPTEKPVELMRHYIGNSTERRQSVLDPFMGSGTTGVACAKLGRKFVGIEIEPKYFDIACERIEKAYAQPDLFIEPSPKLTQSALELVKITNEHS